jgi:hypothetical protein
MQIPKLAEPVSHTLWSFWGQQGNVPMDLPVWWISFGELASMVSWLIDEWDRRSRRQSETIFTLSNQQKERAEWLWFSPERTKMLEHVSGLCVTTLKKIVHHEKILPWAMQYLNTIAASFASKKPLNIEDKDIPKIELEILIPLIFSEENIEHGIPYIMSYFLGFLDSNLEEQTINVRLLTGLLDFWRSIGSNHELFGRVPTEYVPEMEVFKSYTAYFDRDWYFTVPLVNKKWSPESEDYKVIWVDDVPDTFARIGMHYWSAEDIALDSAHYETIYVLWGDIYKYLRPAAKWLRNFIIKHQEFLWKPWNAPWQELKTWEERAWQWAKMLLNQIQARTHSQNLLQPLGKVNQKSKKPNVPSVTHQNKAPDVNLIQKVWGVNVSQTTQIAYASPIISESALRDALCMKTQQISTDRVSLSVSSFCYTIPEGAYLCIKEGTNNWRTEKYRADHTVIFDLVPPGKVRDMLFCFVSENETPSKNLKCTWIHISRPKERKERSEMQGIGNDVPQAVVNILSTPISPIWEVELNKQTQDSPTDIFALDIIESMESIEISRETQNILRIDFSSGEGFFLKFDIKNEKFLEGILPEGVNLLELIPIIQSELQEKVQFFLSWELQSLCTWALTIEEKQTRILLSRFPDFGSRDELLSECRLNWYASWTALLSKSSTLHLQSLQSEFSQVGISLSLERMEKEVQISIWLKSLWKQITIFSQNSIPYFFLENEKFLSEVENKLAINTFLLVNILWKLLVDPPKIQKKNNKSRGNPDTQILSPEQIRDIIEGRYKPKTFSIESLSREELDRLSATIKRFDDGRGRLFVSGGFSDTYGYYRCQVEWHKWWNLSSDDFIVLTDEKISSVPEWKTWQLYVYDMLQQNERLQKYFILKMVATAKSLSAWKPIKFRGKQSFSNWLAQYFENFWEAIPNSAKEEFMNQVATEGWKARNGLSFTYQVNGQDIVLFQSFLDGIRERKIPLMYSRPQIISFGELQEYRKTLWI